MLPKKLKVIPKKMFIALFSFILSLKSQQYSVIFILAHSRSGSTLLQHILFSHQDICGFGENRISYTSQNDFYKLVSQISWYLRKFSIPKKFIVEKIVHHSTLNIDQTILDLSNTRFIFLIRDPVDSIYSLTQGDKSKEEKAADYYMAMLHKLENYCRLINDKNRCFFLTYEELLDNTEYSLIALTDFLQLSAPLNEKYSVLRTSGWGTFGDWSENIKAGKIVRQKRSHSFALSEQSVKNARQAHEKAVLFLRKHCANITSSRKNDQMLKQ